MGKSLIPKISEVRVRCRLANGKTKSDFKIMRTLLKKWVAWRELTTRIAKLPAGLLLHFNWIRFCCRSCINSIKGFTVQGWHCRWVFSQTSIHGARSLSYFLSDGKSYTDILLINAILRDNSEQATAKETLFFAPFCKLRKQASTQALDAFDFSRKSSFYFSFYNFIRERQCLLSL